jgi:iron(III) transport system ATP-binding protein
MIQLQGVGFDRQGRRVLDDLSFEVREGEVVALLGPSGSGKTTLLRLLLGFEAPARGTLFVGGQPASRPGQLVLPPEERGLAVVFQDLALWPHLTVEGNLAFGLEARGTPASQRRTLITGLLERVNLADKARRYPSELSGGEQQRVAIARALVGQPRAVLFDEPLANLDAVLKHQLQALVRQLLRERQTTSIYVTHDLRDALRVADRLLVLEEGRLQFQGSLEELRAIPATPFLAALLDDAGLGKPDAPK